MNKDLLLTKIANEISMSESEMERIKNKIKTLINEISNEFNMDTVRHTYIGSYDFKTVVNYNNDEIDIDCMLTFSKDKANEYSLREKLKEILRKYSEKLNQKIDIIEKEKVIQIIFHFKDESKNYHIDFPITYDDSDKRYLILENNEKELTEAHKICDDFKETFDYDTNKLNYHRNVIKLFKRWVKTNTNDDSSIPSIAILQSCIEVNKYNNSDILLCLKNNLSNIRRCLNSFNEYKLMWEPKNDIFKKKNKSNVLYKLNQFENEIDELNQIDDEKKFIKSARKYFLGEDDNENSVYGDKTSGA